MRTKSIPQREGWGEQMIGKEKLFRKLENILAKSKADQTEIVFIGTHSGLTRFANSIIHQNVHEDNNRIFIRSVIGNKVGIATANSLVTSELLKTLEASFEIANLQPENPGFPGFAKPAKYKEINTFDEATAAYLPKERAAKVKSIISISEDKNFTVAGAFSTSSGEIAVLNSNDLRAYQPFTGTSTNMVVMSDTSSGYTSDTSRSVSDLDFENLARVAVDKCYRSQNPISIEPGEYEVILEPAAIAEALEWLNYVSFGSKGYLQNMSLLSGNIGKKITSDKISIYDDALDEKANAFPFDFEGTPKRKVKIIDKGIAKGVVYDLNAALKGKTKSTGHAITPDISNMGASAFNLFMKQGTVKRSNMINNVKRGILVTRFHYINGLIDPRNAVLTGMTRDGTFLIENGEIKNGLKNMRFTDSMTRAFNSTIAISKERERKDSWWSAVGCLTVPAVHLGSFKFSGKTEF